MGLCAGRKRGRTQNNGKPLHDAPKCQSPSSKRAPMQIALMSTYEVLAQLLENISSPAYRIRYAKVAIQSGLNQVRRELLRHHSRDFMSVLSLSHIWRLTSRLSAQCQRAKVNGHDRSSWPLAGNTCVAISG